ncbi:MAG: hypothetical protein QM802_13850 [Agriterribacter sp.]
MALIQKIYQRSSINLLLFGLGLFVLIALNYKEAIYTFGLKESFTLGFNAFLLLGAAKVIDLGTGLNAQIIGTSNYWKFELTSGIILLGITLPLTYILVKQMGITGPAVAFLISTTIYNSIRIVFLWMKFKLQPFTNATIYTIITAAASYFLCYFTCKNIHGFAGLFSRSILFMLLYGSAIVYFNLSPDVKPVWLTIKKRIGLK